MIFLFRLTTSDARYKQKYDIDSFLRRAFCIFVVIANVNCIRANICRRSIEVNVTGGTDYHFNKYFELSAIKLERLKR